MDIKFGVSTKEQVGCIRQLLRKFGQGKFVIVEIKPDLHKVVFITNASGPNPEPAKEPWTIHKAPNETCKRPWTIMQPGPKAFWQK